MIAVAKKQYFRIILDEVTHEVIYTRPSFSRHVLIEIDGEAFELPRGAREEPFRLGDEQAILCIAKNGKASIRTRYGAVDEVSEKEMTASRALQAKPVLVVFKTHLDVGFTDFAHAVVKRYLNEFIPNAIRVGYELKDTDTPFRWTVGSWLIHEALKCDTSGEVEKAIRDGILNWHALPFTTHTELMNTALFEYGASISAALDARFGRRTVAAKMTDVPGHTVGMVPLLAKRGVKLLHIGVNPATPVPPVPPVFNWQHEGEEITVIYQGNYGEAAEFDDFYLYFAHTNDNCGPQSPDEIVAIYDKIKRQYPNRPVRAATLDDVATLLSQQKNLPVVTGEIGDSWIHGAATDPQKLGRYRALLRRVAEHGTGEVDLCEHLLLVPEHTWGMDIKTYFHNEADFTVDEMERCADMRKTVEASWEEQREYVRAAERALGVEPTLPSLPDLSEYREVEIPHELDFEISWQLFDRSDYERYQNEYLRLNDATRPWAIWDFTKVGLPEYEGGIYTATVKRAYTRGEQTLLRLEFDVDEQAANDVGMPYFYVRLEANNIEIQWFGKRASRLPQACWLKFKGQCEDWQLHKMGTWLSPSDMMGSPLITAVDEGVRNGQVTVKTLDAALVAPYGRQLLHYRTDVKGEPQDLYFNLYNNIWNTNFPMWYEDDALFRFSIVPTDA